jgi:hypothetical protein
MLLPAGSAVERFEPVYLLPVQAMYTSLSVLSDSSFPQLSFFRVVRVRPATL